ncbi:hypothetical protein PR048_029484 [Dryococelus australis]|uniref:Uncharacterized protein n=1 Tax=Dryococelus australis TaxID=614101 RepID=A0ABQ9GFV4_9NEOP|nr:hypothetical protein PR048_029484 [Dryococelus australis]
MSDERASKSAHFTVNGLYHRIHDECDNDGAREDTRLERNKRPCAYETKGSWKDERSWSFDSRALGRRDIYPWLPSRKVSHENRFNYTEISPRFCGTPFTNTFPSFAFASSLSLTAGAMFHSLNLWRGFSLSRMNTTRVNLIYVIKSTVAAGNSDVIDGYMMIHSDNINSATNNTVEINVVSFDRAVLQLRCERGLELATRVREAQDSVRPRGDTVMPGLIHYDVSANENHSAHTLQARGVSRLLSSSNDVPQRPSLVVIQHIISHNRSRGGVVVGILASHLGETGFDSRQGLPGSSLVGIVPDGAADLRVFPGISRFPRPCIPALLHSHLVYPSSALKTSILRGTIHAILHARIFLLDLISGVKIEKPRLTSHAYKEGKSCNEICIVAKRDWTAMACTGGYFCKTLASGRRAILEHSAIETQRMTWAIKGFASFCQAWRIRLEDRKNYNRTEEKVTEFCITIAKIATIELSIRHVGGTGARTRDPPTTIDNEDVMRGNTRAIVLARGRIGKNVYSRSRFLLAFRIQPSKNRATYEQGFRKDGRNLEQPIERACTAAQTYLTPVTSLAARSSIARNSATRSLNSNATPDPEACRDIYSVVLTIWKERASRDRLNAASCGGLPLFLRLLAYNPRAKFCQKCSVYRVNSLCTPATRKNETANGSDADQQARDSMNWEWSGKGLLTPPPPTHGVMPESLPEDGLQTNYFLPIKQYGHRFKVPWVYDAQREHCTSIQSLALSGDGALEASGNIVLITPTLVGFKRGGWNCASKAKERGSNTGDSYAHAWRLVAPTRKACSVSVVALHWSARGDRDMRINSLIAFTRKALNWLAVLPSTTRLYETDHLRGRRQTRSTEALSCTAPAINILHVQHVFDHGHAEQDARKLTQPAADAAYVEGARREATCVQGRWGLQPEGSELSPLCWLCVQSVMITVRRAYLWLRSGRSDSDPRYSRRQISRRAWTRRSGVGGEKGKKRSDTGKGDPHKTRELMRPDTCRLRYEDIFQPHIDVMVDESTKKGTILKKKKKNLRSTPEKGDCAQRKQNHRQADTLNRDRKRANMHGSFDGTTTAHLHERPFVDEKLKSCARKKIKYRKHIFKPENNLLHAYVKGRDQYPALSVRIRNSSKQDKRRKKKGGGDLCKIIRKDCGGGEGRTRSPASGTRIYESSERRCCRLHGETMQSSSGAVFIPQFLETPLPPPLIVPPSVVLPKHLIASMGIGCSTAEPSQLVKTDLGTSHNLSANGRKPMRVIEVCNSAGMKGRGKREIPEKTHRPTASFGTIPTYEQPELTAQPSWPHEKCGYWHAKADYEDFHDLLNSGGFSLVPKWNSRPRCWQDCSLGRSCFSSCKHKRTRERGSAPASLASRCQTIYKRERPLPLFPPPLSGNPSSPRALQMPGNLKPPRFPACNHLRDADSTLLPEMLCLHPRALNKTITDPPPLFPHSFIQLNGRVFHKESEVKPVHDKGRGKAGDPRESPPTSGIVQHDSHIRKFSSDPGAQRHDRNTARLARRSDEALVVRVSVARIAPALLHLKRVAPTANELPRGERRQCVCGCAIVASTNFRSSIPITSEQLPVCVRPAERLVDARRVGPSESPTHTAPQPAGVPSPRSGGPLDRPKPRPAGVEEEAIYTAVLTGAECASAKHTLQLAAEVCAGTLKVELYLREPHAIALPPYMAGWAPVAWCEVSWRLLSAVHTRLTQQEPVTRVEPGETECTAATHERVSRHPLHTCCDVNCTTTFKWPMCKLANDQRFGRILKFRDTVPISAGTPKNMARGPHNDSLIITFHGTRGSNPAVFNVEFTRNKIICICPPPTPPSTAVLLHLAVSRGWDTEAPSSPYIQLSRQPTKTPLVRLSTGDLSIRSQKLKFRVKFESGDFIVNSLYGAVTAEVRRVGDEAATECNDERNRSTWRKPKVCPRFSNAKTIRREVSGMLCEILAVNSVSPYHTVKFFRQTASNMFGQIKLDSPDVIETS